MKAALYCRVSTEEQGNKGYSLRQQLEALRELVAEGGVDIVLAQNRDRLTREPAYHYLLRIEFKEHGCKLRALNDRSDESPEGELSDGVVDLIAKYERARIASRTSEGKYRKAREGKIPGTGTPPLGFRYEDGHYFVVEEKMSLVRDIFQRVADGQSLNEVVKHLQSTGAPTPGGGKWHRTTLRTLIFNDTYDGVYYYGRSTQGKRRTPVVKTGDGEKVYGYKTETEEHPREEW